jgi:hypothetical protein
MPRLETEISELATALGALGHDLTAALERRPDQILNVADDTWARLREAHGCGEHSALFASSWANGHAFLWARDGLRGRLPIRVEWKGPDRQVEQDPIPADLRVDNVFLVSVKSRSAVLWNRSPSQVFTRTPMALHWFEHTAPDQYQALYATARSWAGMEHLPERASELTRSDGVELGRQLPSREWPESLRSHYLAMVEQCSTASARLWNAALMTSAQRERTAWWILRLAPAPYFLLGDSVRAPLRIRVDTPWDWRQSWRFIGFEVRAAVGAGQPQVDWAIHVEHRETGESRIAEGYVEIRWSHGRFSGHPEAKIQLRTAHELVPGYTALL